MTREVTIRWNRQSVALPLALRSVLLCDGVEQARQAAAAMQAAGAIVIPGADGTRGRVAEQLPKRSDQAAVERVREALRLDADVLEWRPRDSSLLQRTLAETLVALVSAADLLVFDLTRFEGSPFDVAHACAFLRRVSAQFDVTLVAVIADAALVSSAGSHLVVLDESGIAEAGEVAQVLADPQSDALRQRLEATPIPSPVAMQMRRVQRVTTRPVNYAHTTIIELPTLESIALAGGDA